MKQSTGKTLEYIGAVLTLKKVIMLFTWTAKNPEGHQKALQDYLCVGGKSAINSSVCCEYRPCQLQSSLHHKRRYAPQTGEIKHVRKKQISKTLKAQKSNRWQSQLNNSRKKRKSREPFFSNRGRSMLGWIVTWKGTKNRWYFLF